MFQRLRIWIIAHTEATPEDRLFWGFQKSLFTLLVIGVLTNSFYQLFEPGATFQVIVLAVRPLLLLWGVIFFLSIIIWYMIVKITNFDCFLYYQLWLGWLFQRLYSRNGPNPLVRRFIRSYSQNELARRWDIIDSLAFMREKDVTWPNWPLLIRREHLMRNRLWPRWVYSIILLLTQV